MATVRDRPLSMNGPEYNAKRLALYSGPFILKGHPHLPQQSRHRRSTFPGPTDTKDIVRLKKSHPDHPEATQEALLLGWPGGPGLG